jgi:hypothetical protein
MPPAVTTTPPAATTTLAAGGKNLFDRVDGNHDNTITRDEFGKATGNIIQTVVPPAATTLPPVATTTRPSTSPPTLPSQSQQDSIVKKHNDLRAAMGASDMMMMKWDATLASAAQQFVASCPSGHSQNRANTVGENMAWKWSSNFQLTASTDFGPSIQAWYDEIKDAGPYKTGGVFRGFGQCTGVCGHYTQVVWAAANLIGCGVKFCPHRTGMAGYELVCQYGSSVGYGGNMGGATLFTKGRACSSCPGGFSTCSNNMCTAR